VFTVLSSDNAEQTKFPTFCK